VGSLEPECDPLDWIVDADTYNPLVTTPVYEAQATRMGRRVPAARIPGSPRGITGLYDVSDDWMPIYDRTSIDGYFVAIGTSGNQFKNAPVIGSMLSAVIDACEHGHDHDSEPVVWQAPRTGATIGMGHYSRLRARNPNSSNTVLG
jgi:sarcosine oxidase subunit beta